jgi:hypothetical protein
MLLPPGRLPQRSRSEIAPNIPRGKSALAGPVGHPGARSTPHAPHHPAAYQPPLPAPTPAPGPTPGPLSQASPTAPQIFVRANPMCPLDGGRDGAYVS